MITAVTGLNGAGKTAYAVGMLRAYQARGVPIYANIGVRGAGLIRSFEHLMELRDCVVLLDEITAVASSRQSQSMSPEALLFFQTLRHANVGCVYTCPTIERADIALRSLTLRWVALSPLIATRPKGGIWKNTHVSLVRSGRPIEGGTAEGTGSKMANPWLSLYRPARNHEDYDSYADVDLFTRSAKWPARCPSCGASVDYGRVTASTDHAPAGWEATYWCPRCGTVLGKAVRPLLDLSRRASDVALGQPLSLPETA